MSFLSGEMRKRSFGPLKTEYTPKIGRETETEAKTEKFRRRHTPILGYISVSVSE